MENKKVKQEYMNKILNKIGEKSNDVNNDKENNKGNNNNNEDINKINNIEESNMIGEKKIIEKEEKKIINKDTKKNNEEIDNSKNYHYNFDAEAKKHNKTFDRESTAFNNSEKSDSSSLLLNSNSFLNKTKSTKISNKNKKFVELKDIKDTFNLNGDMHELFIQSVTVIRELVLFLKK